MITFGYDLEATGPNPFDNKIITIQYRRNGINHLFKIWDYNDSEKELLTHFIQDWDSIPAYLSHGGDHFVTYNLRLTAPFLLSRCLTEHVGDSPAERKVLWNAIIHRPAFLDIYQLLGDRSVRLDEWRQIFGVGSSRIKNFDIPNLYYEGKYSEIEEYINDELIALEKIYYALTSQPFMVELESLRRRLKPVVSFA